MLRNSHDQAFHVRHRTNNERRTAYLEQQTSMTVANRSCSLAVKRKPLNGLVKVVELLSKVQRTDQHFVPTTSFVGKSSETFGADPLQEVHIRHI